MRSVPRIRIAVGYPADAKPGRTELEKTISSLIFKQLRADLAVDFELVAWDTHAGPGLHEDGPQGWIDLALKISECDLFVAVFHQRLGTPLSMGSPPRSYPSGTAYEIMTALESWRKDKRPTVWVFFPDEFRDEKCELVELEAALAEFRSHILPREVTYQGYSSWPQLGELFGAWLFKFATDSVNATRDGERTSELRDAIFTANAYPRAIPAECLTGSAGEIEISMFLNSVEDSEFFWQGRVVVYLNTNLTAPIDGEFNSVTLTVYSTAPGSGVRKAWAKVSGRPLGVNAVEFPVTVQFSKAPIDARLRISGLLVNANQLGFGDARKEVSVVAFVAVTSFDSQRVLLKAGNVQCQLGVVKPTFSLRLSDNRRVGLDVGRVFWARCGAFSSDIRCATINVRLLDFLPDPFVAHFVGNQLDARSGIRMMLRLTGIPEKATLFVCEATNSHRDSHEWRLVPADATGADNFDMRLAGDSFAINGVPHRQLDSTLGSAMAVYALLRRRKGYGTESQFPPPEELSLVVSIANAEISKNELVQLRLSGCLAPLSTVTVGSSTAPVPRFADMSSMLSVEIHSVDDHKEWAQ